jgi:two-component system phosphate regulon sensor histidine kinase PhoR
MAERIWLALGVLAVALGCAGTLLGLGASTAVILIGAALFGLATLLVLELVLRPPEPDTERRSSRKTQDSEGFGRALLGRMPVPFLVINDRRMVTYANPAAEALLPRLQLGQHLTSQLRAPQVLEVIEEVAKTQQERATFFTLKSGAEQKLLARVALLPPGGDFGDDARAMIQLEDHTDQHRAMEMRSDFIANASHELRTPLASIIGYIETLQGHAKDDPQAQAHFLSIMQRQADRMQRLIEDLMWLSRIELSEHVRPEGLVDLSEVAQEVSASLAPVAKSNRAEIDLSLGTLPADVTGDRDQITQVVVNLVDNAIKYGGAGVTVAISLKRGDVRFPGRIGLSVEDNGPGIPREEIPRLTERFYRLSTKKNAQTDGTGLGLAIVKHILNRHSGELDIWSEEGMGSRFTIWLPVRGGAATNAGNVVQLFDQQK